MATYSPEQLTSYLRYIRFPNPVPPPPPTFATLQLLIIHQLTTIPFENLSIHYRSSAASPSQASPIDVNPDAVLRKLVPSSYGSFTNGVLNNNHEDEKNGEGENGVRKPSDLRGGYCMEVSTIFSTVLRTLGYNIWTVGARGSMVLSSAGKDKSGEFGGWDHMATIVDLSSSCPSSVSTNGHDGNHENGTTNGLWFIDVGFGGNGPLSPIPLIDGALVAGQGSQRHRIIRRPSPSPHVDLGWIMQTGQILYPTDDDFLDENDKSSIITTTANPDGTTTKIKWTDAHNFYPFVPFTTRDFTVMSYSTSTHPDAGMRQIIMCVRMMRDDELTPAEKEEYGDDVKGRITLWNRWLTRKVQDKTEIIKELETEEERVEALEKWFGIVVEREGIKGAATEINEANLKRWREEEEIKKKEAEAEEKKRKKVE